MMQLQVTSDGTKAGTHQTELESTEPTFYDGTYAARIYFTDGPAVGKNGDHINESFYAISSPNETRQYSELDYEYMPNGGWGSIRPELDTTSWHSSKQGDRVYHPTYQRLHGWHTVMITVHDGRTDYLLDGKKLFSNDASYSLHGPVDVAFSTWLIDLPFAGKRTWNMQVNWFYYQAGKVLTLSQVNKAVKGYYVHGQTYVNTLAASPAEAPRALLPDECRRIGPLALVAATPHASTAIVEFARTDSCSLCEQ
ncbi:glycoside hydrolase family 16 protein [Streptacidiphilus monticola]